MMSYEKKMMENLQSGGDTPDKLDVSILKYMWDASPLSFRSSENYHSFFRKISILNSFSDNEIRHFTKFLHRREFDSKEVIFRQGDAGYGFYYIFSGSVNIFSNQQNENPEEYGDLIIRLDKRQFFGEMGLLEQYNRRNATAVAAESTVLLGIFKPDLDRMLEQYPVLGAKFLRETSLVMANRIGQITREIVALKKKVRELEQRI